MDKKMLSDDHPLSDSLEEVRQDIKKLWYEVDNIMKIKAHNSYIRAIRIGLINTKTEIKDLKIDLQKQINDLHTYVHQNVERRVDQFGEWKDRGFREDLSSLELSLNIISILKKYGWGPQQNIRKSNELELEIFGVILNALPILCPNITEIAGDAMRKIMSFIEKDNS